MQAVSTSAISPDQVSGIYLKHLNSRGMMPMVLDLERSRGVELVDALSGRTLLDFFGFYASSAVGLNHPKFTSDEDFVRRLHFSSVNKITNSDVRSTYMARMLETFERVGMPEAFPHAFFVEGGTLAVENALKAAFDWKVRRNHARGYRREVGHQVMHFEQAFHGRSGYTLSLTNTSDPRKTMYFPRFDWPRVVNPKITFPEDANLEDLVRRERLALEQAKRHFHERRDDIACAIIEPIQGEGGDNHFRPGFLQALKDLCLENDALLVFDEVQTGIGITGSFWAYQALGVEPDLLAFGKKTQVCGILAGRRIEEVDENVFELGSRINSTWGGNLVDMVRFDRILEIIEEEDLVAHAASAGAHLKARLHEIAGRNPSVTNVRGRGLMCAIDLPTTDARAAVLKACFDDGLVILGSGTNAVRFRTPLNISTDELDRGLGILERAIGRTAAA